MLCCCCSLKDSQWCYSEQCEGLSLSPVIKSLVLLCMKSEVRDCVHPLHNISILRAGWVSVVQHDLHMSHALIVVDTQQLRMPSWVKNMKKMEDLIKECIIEPRHFSHKTMCIIMLQQSWIGICFHSTTRLSAVSVCIYHTGCKNLLNN